MIGNVHIMLELIICIKLKMSTYSVDLRESLLKIRHSSISTWNILKLYKG